MDKKELDGNQRVVEATADAEEEWVQTIIGLARMNEKFLADCTPGYYNKEGKPEARSLQNANYGAGTRIFPTHGQLAQRRDPGRAQTTIVGARDAERLQPSPASLVFD